MGFKIIFLVLLTLIGFFIGFRFGLFGDSSNLPLPIREIIPPSPTASPIPLTPIIEKTFKDETTIKLLNAPDFATISARFTLSWYVDNLDITTTNHTAIHYGKTPRPDAKLPSDYPEKSAILKGTIPATFSATLSIPTLGIYYLRAHAIIDNRNIWSAEKIIHIIDATSSSIVANP